MRSDSLPPRFLSWKRGGFFAAVQFLLALSLSSFAGDKEERLEAWRIFLAAKRQIVAQCIYQPKAEDVYWGALSALAKDLGPEAAKIVPQRTEGSEEDALKAYVDTLQKLNERLHISFKGLVCRSIRGYARSIDPFDDYDEIELYNRIQEANQYHYVGIGVAMLEHKGEGFFLNPLPDGPAERAGILAGDSLLEVGGTSIKGLSKDEIRLLCLGKPGSKLTLKVAHPDTTVETVEVIRDQMESSPVTVEEFPSEIRIGCQRSLTDQMVADVSKAIHSPGSKKKILTIDLRGCGGGKVETAVSFASLFLPADDLIAKLETVNGREKLMSSNPSPFYPSKMVILQDRFTASAAEIIIVALVSNHRFPVETRGQRSYGKGVTQRAVQIDSDEKGTPAGVLKITDTRIYGPHDEVWDGEGLPAMVEAK